MMQGVIPDFLVWFNIVFAAFKSPPLSGIFIMLVSVTISSISNLAMKRFSDVRMLRMYQQEIKQYQKMQQELQKNHNEKLARKLKRRKAYIDRIQREMTTARCKPSLIFFIPFVLFFSILRGFYSHYSGDPSLDLIVAVVPFNIHKVLPFVVNMFGVVTPAGFGLTFTGFYFLSGLGLSSILQRMMGTQIM
jgi:uncharacterized membrane protein (DUF106 family)